MSDFLKVEHLEDMTLSGIVPYTTFDSTRLEKAYTFYNIVRG